MSPDPIDSKTLLSLDWKGFTGQAVQISVFSGGTSGRFQVAKIVARVFPAYKAFAQNVIAEGIEPASDFPFGPYPSDKLTYRGKSRGVRNSGQYARTGNGFAPADERKPD